MTNGDTDNELPNLGLLIKLLKMTSSTHDAEALSAMRKANEQLVKFGGDWERLLRGKVTVIGDPFIGVQAPRTPPTSTRPAPPPPAPQAPRPVPTPPSSPAYVPKHAWGQQRQAPRTATAQAPKPYHPRPAKQPAQKIPTPDLSKLGL